MICMGNKSINSHELDYEQWTAYLKLMLTEAPHWAHTSFTVAMVVIFVAGVCGNLLVCVVIYCDRSMHTATNYYIFNLAVTDLLMAFGILLELDEYYTNYLYEFYGMGDWICKVHFFFVFSLWNTDILTITALAVERYIVIFHPLVLNRKPSRRLVKIICLIWFIAIFVALPETLTVRLANSSRFSRCWIAPTPFTRYFNSFVSLVTFIVPLVIMLFVYTMIACKVKTAETSYSEVKMFNHGNRSSKVSKLVLSLTVSFVVCWLPFFCFRITFALGSYPGLSWLFEHWDLLIMVAAFNSWFTIVLNPLLFSLMSTKFRKALKKFYNTKIKRYSKRSITV